MKLLIVLILLSTNAFSKAITAKEAARQTHRAKKILLKKEEIEEIKCIKEFNRRVDAAINKSSLDGYCSNYWELDELSCYSSDQYLYDTINRLQKLGYEVEAQDEGYKRLEVPLKNEHERIRKIRIQWCKSNEI